MRLFLLFILLLYSAVSAAQDKKGFSTDKKSTDSSGRTYALVVGISKYKNKGIPPLQYADKDAREFRKYLIETGVDSSRIFFLSNEEAVSVNILMQLSDIIETVQKGDRFYFYFSGHGDVESKSYLRDAFLLTHESLSHMYMSSSLSVYHLQGLLATMSAKGAQVIFICDACHSGNLAGGREGMKAAASTLGDKWQDAIKILSCSPGEYSLEGPDWGKGRGLFSFEFINGITGLADKNLDNSVSLKEMNLYLVNSVSEAAGSISQVPVVTGDMETELAVVHPELLAQLSGLKRAETWAKVDGKGIEETILKTQPDSVRVFYNRYMECMKSGKLSAHDYIPMGAYEYLKKIPENDSTRQLVAIMKRNLSARMIKEVNYYVNYSLENQGYDNYGFAVYYSYDYLKELKELMGVEKLKSLGFLPKILFMKMLYDEYVLYHPSKKALAALDSVLSLEPKAAYALALYAYIEKEKGHYESARDYALRSIDVSPLFAYPYQVLSEVYLSLEKLDSSMLITRKLIAMDSTYMGYASLILALNYYFRNQMDSSNHYFEEYFSIINTVKDCWNCDLTSLYSSQSRFQSNKEKSGSNGIQESIPNADIKQATTSQEKQSEKVSASDIVNDIMKSDAGYKGSMSYTNDYYLGYASDNFLRSTDYRQNLFEFIDANNKILGNRGRTLEENENETENRMYFAPARVNLSPNIYFKLACEFSANGKDKRALHYLSRALNSGFRDYERFVSAQELNSLREYPFYKKMMNEYFEEELTGEK